MKNIILMGILGLVVAGAGVYFFISNKAPIATETVEEAVAETSPMSFFVTSGNPGKGGDLGGLAGADAYCTSLAEAAGVTGKTWRAYLSSGATENNPVVNARDRIGNGPWYNAKGVLIATDIDQLHGENNINKETALTEKGEVVSGRGDEKNTHDMLTGSDINGIFAAGKNDTTCNNWSSSSTGSAIVGHHDRVGINESDAMKSWNSSHETPGCRLQDFRGVGGAGLFYCFAE